VPPGGDPVEPLLPPRQGRGTFGWSKDFLEAGKQRLVGDTERQADGRQVNEMRAELEQLTCASRRTHLPSTAHLPWRAVPGGAGSGRCAAQCRKAAGGRAVAEEPSAQTKLAGQGTAVGQMTLAPHSLRDAARCVLCSAGVRRSPADKREINELVEHCALPVGRTLAEVRAPHPRPGRGRCGRFWRSRQGPFGP